MTVTPLRLALVSFLLAGTPKAADAPPLRVSMIPTTDPVITGLAKDSDMRSKPILESTTDVREPAIVRYVRRCIIEPRIYLWKARVYRVSSRAGEKTTAAAEYVWRQVNARPEIIQRESHHEVSADHTCSRTA